MSKIYLNENFTFNNKTLINVDIQPEYENGIVFISEWIDFLNDASAANHIVFLYNGADTLGMISEADYKMWLLENGMNENVIDNSEFYDKGYAFFRNCMDHDIDEDEIVDLIRYMIKHDINDSRDIESHNWDDFTKTHDTVGDIREYLEDNEDMMYIPDLMDYLKKFKNIILMGGGIDECLREVEIALEALNMKYNTYQRFVY